MNTKNRLRAKIILGIYLTATCVLLLLGYSAQKPRVKQQDFPFSITYSYQGKIKTIMGVYAGEYDLGAKYMEDEPTAWYGYVKDHNRLEADFYRIAEQDGKYYSINLNLEPGYLMGDPRYADAVCQPTAVCHISDGEDSISITDPVELEQLGFSIVSWEYPEPIDNSFSFGGIYLSSEATMFTAALAVAALLACVILIRKDPEVTYIVLDKVSIAVNVLVALIAFPFILIVSCLSEILSDVSLLQQILYLTPAITVLGIAASVTLRRMGQKRISFWISFVGPVLFGLLILLDVL